MSNKIIFIEVFKIFKFVGILFKLEHLITH